MLAKILSSTLERAEVFELTASLMQRARNKAAFLIDVRWKFFRAVLPFVDSKKGLEIGGPSQIFQGGLRWLPLYARVGSLDNCDFSSDTTWAQHRESYTFSAKKPPGKNVFEDGSNLSSIASHSYDFILSSHNLEHFANPVKALEEWKRVVRPGGALVLVLPNYSWIFDHRRAPTSVDHMFQDFREDTQEDDLTHLPEILDKHDLSMDPGIKDPEAFRRRSLDNFHNRCLHHHVFDQQNSRELLARCGMDVLAVAVGRPIHLLLLARIP